MLCLKVALLSLGFKIGIRVSWSNGANSSSGVPCRVHLSGREDTLAWGSLDFDDFRGPPRPT